MKKTSLRQIDGITYFVRPVKKLWEGCKVSIKDYQKDDCIKNGHGLIIELYKEIMNKETDQREWIFIDKMTLEPSRVEEGMYSTSKYFEKEKPFKNGYLINYRWHPDPKPVQTSLFEIDSMRTEACLMTMSQAWKMLQDKTQHI